MRKMYFKKTIYLFFIICYLLFLVCSCAMEGDLDFLRSKLTGNRNNIDVNAVINSIEMVEIPAIEDFDVGNKTVKLSSFKMGKYEVTQEQWLAVMGEETNPSYLIDNPAADEVQEKRPVECVSWYDAVEFCNKLSELKGLIPAYTIDKVNKDPNNTNSYDTLKWTVTINAESNGYRLPTEVQWQYAAQSGSSAEYKATVNNAWYSDNSDNRTHEVGKKEANAFGLYDMLGNVWEWCWDWYGSSYPSEDEDPMGASSGAGRIGRGGSWNYSSEVARTQLRDSSYPSYRDFSYGFRLVSP